MRFLVAIAIAGLVNVGLFLLMSYMTAGQDGAQSEDEGMTVVEFVRLKREAESPELKQRKLPKKPPPPEKLPPPSTSMPKSPLPQPNAPTLPAEIPDIDLPLSLKGTGPYLGDYRAAPAAPTSGETILSAREGEVIPLVRTLPRYPRNAARRRLEGSVTVEFIIRKDGSVRAPKVVASHPPGVFDRAALEAIKKWKFKPKLMEGEPVEQRATQEIEFNLPG
ncbi:energy transducer TonB [Nitrosococcus wardiae]|uniref:Protein TonB n=1 Tax=Nitrosococcus wardiae TaxID=1814290 RepID=A0A4P7BUJ8_9GAMM|nr:energy transducer TonB [Nitrosococcus wardiae]QBQ53618.1 energy transducer TonB [Nitrosococcus wardiae]